MPEPSKIEMGSQFFYLISPVDLSPIWFTSESDAVAAAVRYLGGENFEGETITAVPVYAAREHRIVYRRAYATRK